MSRLDEIPDRYKRVFQCSKCGWYFGWTKFGSFVRVTCVEKKLRQWAKRKLHLVVAA